MKTSGKASEITYIFTVRSQREAAWGITNLTMGGTPAQLDALMSAGFLEPYCALLESTDLKAVAVVLDGITNLLQAAAKFGQAEALSLTLEEISALDLIENLQHHENEEIYEKSHNIIDTYFCAQEDVAAQPEQNNEEFQFGSNQENPNIHF